MASARWLPGSEGRRHLAQAHHLQRRADQRVSNLVALYALLSRMRVLSSPAVIDAGDQLVRAIIETYLAPNKTFRDLSEELEKHAMNPRADFGNACHEELRGRDPS
ncbi:MAG TPA: hypothetical protein VEV21_17110 [Burkholderiales bacterium]|nr:hypothetical protein [Burkholderiales bacterium]